MTFYLFIFLFIEQLTNLTLNININEFKDTALISKSDSITNCKSEYLLTDNFCYY
jgi:hypothetical protein